MTQKHKIAQAIRDELQKFVGQRNDEFTRANTQADLRHVLVSFSETLGFKAELPEIIVEIEGNTATVTLVDSKTGEVIPVSEWLTRAEGGFYG